MFTIVKKRFVVTICLFIIQQILNAQIVEDFEFTTVDGTHYSLYADLLNKDKPVMFHTTTAS